MAFILLIALVFGAVMLLTGAGRTCTVRLQLVDEDGSPAAGVDVLHMGASTVWFLTKTNLLGYVDLKAPCGTTLTIQYGGGEWVLSERQIVVVADVTLVRTVYKR